MASPEVRFRVDFSEACSVGAGKIELLETIARTGSLSQAARELSMSYRRAWLLVDSLNRDFDTPVARTSVGGSGGGGAVLTEFGCELIAAYRALDGGIRELADRKLRSIAGHITLAKGGSEERGALGGVRRQRIARRLG
ncbi:MAG TPA: LysR family transcriptional regulator [Steroidobacteraceae bacterium]|jgi:molybdate transport system regulatory protein|nr:LysR family transcriptional regulator [Steroidobacteraceae bacterium]